MQPLISIIQPQGAMGSDEFLNHPPGSEEFVLILRGELYFEIANEEMKLEEGDTVYFEGDLPHYWENRSDRETEVLFMWTPPVW
jgi:quercetin dioxygenase-like cupin family protein